MAPLLTLSNPYHSINYPTQQRYIENNIHDVRL